MQPWDFGDSQWEMKFPPYQVIPGQESLGCCYHFMLSSKEGEVSMSSSADSPHTTLEIKPADLHPVSMSRTFLPQGTEQLSLPTSETRMCFLGTPQLLIYKLTAMSCVSSQDWFLLLKGCWKAAGYFCATLHLLPKWFRWNFGTYCIWGHLSFLVQHQLPGGF